MSVTKRGINLCCKVSGADVHHAGGMLRELTSAESHIPAVLTATERETAVCGSRGRRDPRLD